MSSLLAVKWAAMVVVTLLMMGETTCLKIRIESGTSLEPYNPSSYRLRPYFTVGLYSVDSMLARLSGHTDHHPRLDFSIDISGDSSAAPYVQLYVYNKELVEDTVIPSLPYAVSPCMDLGQSVGVAPLPGLNGKDAYRIRTGRLMVGGAMLQQLFTVRERLYPETTGLYVITLNACRYVNETDGDGSGRVLDLSGWSDLRFSGYVGARNPYGYLPGQLYGLMPGYHVLAGISVLALAVFLIGWVCVGVKQVIGVHRLLGAIHGLSVIAYAMLASYYTVINEDDVDTYGLFVAARVLLILRNTIGYSVLVCISLGWGLTPILGRGVTKKHLVTVFGVAMVRVAINMAEFGLLQRAADLGASTGLMGLTSLQHVGSSWKACRVVGFVVDGLICAFVAYSLWRVCSLRTTTVFRRRIALYRRTAAVLGCGGLVGLLFWVSWTYAMADGPLGTLSEAHWQWMWLPEMLYEATFAASFVGLLLVWFPRKGDLRLLHAEALPTEEVAPPTAIAAADANSFRNEVAEADVESTHTNQRALTADVLDDAVEDQEMTPKAA